MSAVVGRPPRAELARQAQQLRAQGKLAREIAEILGVSRSYASALAGNDPDGQKAKRLKISYRGTCEGCGGATTGCNGPNRAPRFCSMCSATDPDRRAKLTKWTPELILARIREWADLHGEPPAIADWNPNTSRHIYHDEARAQRFEQADGHWPWFTIVIVNFGTWNAALTAAGFDGRAGHGGSGNSDRNRGHVRLMHRAALAQKLCDQGLTLADVSRAVYERWGYKNARTANIILSRGGGVRSSPHRYRRMRTPPDVVLAALDELEAIR